MPKETFIVFIDKVCKTCLYPITKTFRTEKILTLVDFKVPYSLKRLHCKVLLKTKKEKSTADGKN